MTVTRTLAVWCDNPECVEWTWASGRTAGEARRDTRRQGWHTVNPGQDVCPECWANGHRPPWPEPEPS